MQIPQPNDGYALRNYYCATLLWSTSVLLCLTFSVAHAVEEQHNADKCNGNPLDQPLDAGFGSVALFANLRSTPDSIRAVAKQMLSQALEETSIRTATCPVGCVTEAATIIYKVLPTAFLDQAKQRKVCLEYENDTTETPLRFAEKRFTSLDDLNEWIMNFSRGKGPEGKELYRLCSSNCSPRYTFFINNNSDEDFHVESEVVCGLARDRENKRYSLSTSLRSRCANKAF